MTSSALQVIRFARPSQRALTPTEAHLISTDSQTPAVAAPPLACVPIAIPAEHRQAHFTNARQLFTEKLRERLELENGYAFRFDAHSFEQVALFVSHERSCCPWLSFSLELAPSHGALWLRLTGPAGAREFVDAELTAL